MGAAALVRRDKTLDALAVWPDTAVTDGSLSSCPPAEAVTWGKVDKDSYLQTTESMQADYSMVMPFLVKALLDNHSRREGYRLYEQRDSLCEKLRGDVRANRDWLLRSVDYPLAAQT